MFGIPINSTRILFALPSPVLRVHFTSIYVTHIPPSAPWNNQIPFDGTYSSDSTNLSYPTHLLALALVRPPYGSTCITSSGRTVGRTISSTRERLPAWLPTKRSFRQIYYPLSPTFNLSLPRTVYPKDVCIYLDTTPPSLLVGWVIT